MPTIATPIKAATAVFRHRLRTLDFALLRKKETDRSPRLPATATGRGIVTSVVPVNAKQPSNRLSAKRSRAYLFLPDRNTATLSPARSAGVNRSARSVRRRLLT